MLSINKIMNVNYTPNRNTTFGSGMQTNYDINVPSAKDNMVEGGLLTGFVGTIAPALSQIQTRANSIKEGLSKSKIDYFA